ncbi:ABC transporter substrate-binding protein, partial [Achromobacter dolens]
MRFTDMLGNPVTQAAPATRAVSLPMPGGTLLMSLDGGSSRHLAGMHPDSYARMADPVPSRLFPHMESVRSDITRSG